MPVCLVNSVPAAPIPGLQTWGELLADLDGRLAHDRRIVTAARFDGVDQPSFRASPVVDRALATVSRIEVDAIDARVLLGETLDMARESLPVLATSARQCAQAFRTGQLPTAQQHLATLIDAVRTLMALTDASASAARVDLAAVQNALTDRDDVFARLSGALDTLVTRQVAEDWPALAGTLEDEFASAVTGWCRVLDAIAEGGMA
jgi:hypothetical protein